MSEKYEVTDLGATEYGSLVRDAKRYRWLRDMATPELSVYVPDYYAIDGEQLDAAIDAAMEAAK